MKYSPDEEGSFNSQTDYDYISFDKFVDAIAALKENRVSLDELDRQGLPTHRNTMATIAILKARRISLDQKRSVDIEVDGEPWSLR